QPDTSSNRTSARCTLRPSSFGRVRLYTPPTMGRPERFASATLERLIGLISESRYRVSSAVNHGVLFGFFSTRSENVSLRSGGSGRFHHTHARLAYGATFSKAALSVRVCQGAKGLVAVRLAGNSTPWRTPTTNKRGRDCGTNSAASTTIAPTR